MSIRYLLIDTDGVGSFGTQLNGCTTSWLDGLVGPEGWYRVRLHPSWRMSGFVNDCGLLAPETYPRNVVGSVTLCTFGAGQQPYAGPVVFTGWDETATARGGLEICSAVGAGAETVARQSTHRMRRCLMGMPTIRRLRWCSRCRQCFQVDSRLPHAKVCWPCGLRHEDKRVALRFHHAGRR